MDMIIQGIIAAATVLYLISYIGFRRVCAYLFIVDVVVTGGFVLMFAGSYAGMMTGIIAGLAFSMTMRGFRHVFGVEKPNLARARNHVLPTVVWIRSKS